MSDSGLQDWERLLRAVRDALKNEEVSATPDGEDEGMSAGRPGDFPGAMGQLGEEISGILPPALQQNSEISDVLTAASEVEDMNASEVAQILADHAYTLAQRLDPHSEGRGVLQFKTSLHTLLRVNPSKQTLSPEDKVNAIKDFFTKYQKYIKELEQDIDKNREALARAWRTARVLGAVLEDISGTERVYVDQKLAQDIKEAAEKTEELKKEKYNIVPWGIENAAEPVLFLPEVRTVISYLLQPSGLPQPQRRKRFADILEYLQFTFGFQEDNVNNQREHLLLLVASGLTQHRVPQDVLRRQPEEALKVPVKELYDKVLGNYFRWSNFVHAKRDFLRCDNDVQAQLLHIALYFLVWGEAANVRFMPECLCYIFHKMAEELSTLWEKAVAERSECICLPIGSTEEIGQYAFLENVVSPIYEVISKEADYGGHGPTTKGHQEWRNYDDLNEFFWSERCLGLGWPLNLDHGFFTFPKVREVHPEQVPLTAASAASASAPTTPRASNRQQPKRRARRLSKSLFVEWRTFWHVYHSFHRLWVFLVVMLQALVIIAFSGPDSSHTLEKVLTIFPTLAILQALEASTDIMMSIGAYRSMHMTTVLRKLVRLLTAIAWASALTFFSIKTLQELGSSSRPYLGTYAVLLIIYVIPRVVINLVLRCFSPLRGQVDKIEHWTVVRVTKWFYQEEFYIARGMYESSLSFVTYSTFWLVLLISKFLFSYYFQVQPLVGPTVYIVDFAKLRYQWHDLISGNNWNILTVACLWIPVGTIYMLDIQIWYTVLSALLGGVVGAWWRLGEIRSLNMLRNRFRSFPDSFMTTLQPQAAFDRERSQASISRSTGAVGSQTSGRKNARRFAIAWNEIIRCLREEDYLSNKDVDLLLMPANPGNSSLVHWPLFLLANQIHLAMSHAAAHKSNDQDLKKKLCEDEYMRCAVEEALEILEPFLLDITSRSGGATNEQRIVGMIFADISTLSVEDALSTSFHLNKIEAVHKNLTALTGLLVQTQDDGRARKAVKLLQDLYDTVRLEFLSSPLRQQLEQSSVVQGAKVGVNLFSHIRWPSDPARAKRLHLLLTMKESAQEVPRNLEARRRLEFFTNSLFMAMPGTPPVREMLPFCVMTPYFSEIVAYSLKELSEENEDGISTLFYLQKIYPDEWANFLERTGLKQKELEAKFRTGDDLVDLRTWVSFRGQTLARTVRGMMYYRRALQLLAFMESPRSLSTADVEAGTSSEYVVEDTGAHLNDSTRALADLKFTYVVTCQIYGKQKQSKDPRYFEIFALMKEHPGLRIAYIDEKEIPLVEASSDGSTGAQSGELQRSQSPLDKIVRLEYYSCLVRVDAFGQEQEIYRVKLPGPAKLGEGKPENQNHAIIFTRGHALQTIDMNQDNYLEEALKVRNLLEEFKNPREMRRPTILGVREHVFTGSVSSLAAFMSHQETSFVTLGQRVLAYPLKVRMHYGHPDVFDRLFHITRGGISKSSKLIHISEDIFAGFNTTLREGNVTHHEYIQVGKGRDVGLNQIAVFEGKVSGGNGEQMLSRDVYRLGQQFDFYRMLSFYFTSVGFYISTLLTVWCVYFFLYGKAYLALSGVEETLTTRADILGNSALAAALSSQFLLQIGVFTAVPMIVVFVIEKGLAQAVLQFITMQLQLASVFFTFSLGTRAHYFGRTLLHGGAKYRPTGRGFVVRHEKFSELYRIFSRTHFVKGLEVGMLLTVYLVYGSSASTTAYVLLTVSSWFLVASWCFAPFIFNPSGFEWQKIVEDFDDWSRWLMYRGGVGVQANLSWEAWWEEEIGHIRSIRSRFWEVLLSLRFFLFQYGIVYALNVSGDSTSIWVYVWSWVAAAVIVLLFWVANTGRTSDAQLQVRVVQGSLLCGSIIALVVFVIATTLTMADIMAGMLVFIPTGYGLLQILIALRPVVELVGLWKQVRAFARLYDAVMGAIIFFPVALLSWFPFVSTFQSRLMFNQAFSRGLEISLILAGKPQQDGK